MPKTYLEAIQAATSLLEAQGKEGHAIQSVFLTRKGWDKTKWVLSMHEQISATEETQIAADVEQLLADMPPQYLTGVEEFYGRVFRVNEHTLIPRPETEELVDLCLKKIHLPVANVVDIGTGTGAIALTLKAEKPVWQVSAIDISKEALVVAKQNAEALDVDVTFYEGDTLEPVFDKKWDIIISNPPYISQDEWNVMDPSVQKFEPKSALFAEKNGLAMYEKIAKQAKTCLAPNGYILLEIGYRQGTAVQKIFQQAFPNRQVSYHRDLFGNERMVVVH